MRQDGKADFTTVQAALDAAAPNDFVEIQDPGPYNEKLQIGKEGVTLRGKKGAWPVITSTGKTRNFPVLVTVAAANVRLEALVLAHGGASGPDNTALLTPNGTPIALRSVLVWGGDALRLADASMQSCIVFPKLWLYEVRKVHIVAKDSVFCSGIHVYGWEPVNAQVEVENCLICERCDVWNNMQFRRCTLACGIYFHEGWHAGVTDSILPAADARADGLIDFCDVYGEPAYLGQAKPGKGCFQSPPGFLDPKNLDYRIAAGSPCRGRASDGGDVGCRYTSKMIAILKAAFELRRREIIRF